MNKFNFVDHDQKPKKKNAILETLMKRDEEAKN